ncbi:hypothetical protein N8089_00890 [Flavobacteriales bacterium]|jgi:hypothetical protein|nr:hypothetical protein [Flavobacteriales bacterium]
MDGLVILIFYLFLHSPAIIMLVIAILQRKSKPITSKTLFIITGVYFLIGGGVCGTLMGV